jgi:hypothetical protein
MPCTDPSHDAERPDPDGPERKKSGPMTGKTGNIKPKQPKPLIGWREWVQFPDLGVDAIKAKVDTGARTSSLHAFDLKQVDVDGQPRVRFVIHPEQDSSEPAIPVELPLVARRHVRDSGGKAELRPVVEAMVELHGQRWLIEITLTRRDAMGFRMLLGRQAIRRRFVVDPGRSYLAGKSTDSPGKTRTGSGKARAGTGRGMTRKRGTKQKRPGRRS